MTGHSFIALAGAVLVLMPAPISAASPPTLHVVKMELSIKPTQTKYGMVGGYNPTTLTIHVGDTVRWQNVDPETHTATSKLFPTDGRVPTGTTISSRPWSSGDVAGHTLSRAFTAVKAGVYSYSCGYHYKLGQ